MGEKRRIKPDGGIFIRSDVKQGVDVSDMFTTPHFVQLLVHNSELIKSVKTILMLDKMSVDESTYLLRTFQRCAHTNELRHLSGTNEVLGCWRKGDRPVNSPTIFEFDYYVL